MRKWIFAIVAMSASVAAAVGYQPQVIYGNDDRHEVYEVPVPQVRELAQSTAAMIPISNLQPMYAGQAFQVKAPIYGQQNRLCTDEPFYNQPSAAHCSAFFVGADLIATAGHCIQEVTCGRMAFVFDYHMNPDGTAPELVPASNVYRCKAVIARELNGRADYAVVQVERPVMGRRPLALSPRPQQVNDPLIVIGHPAGIPTKVAPGASIRALKDGYFVANLDTYGGNSGSAVFDARTLEVAGILVRGEGDFTYDRTRNCTMSRRCADDGCRGEDVTNISYVGEVLRRIGFYR